MIDVGLNGGDNSGIKPAKSEMINGGEPSVIHVSAIRSEQRLGESVEDLLASYE